MNLLLPSKPTAKTGTRSTARKKVWHRDQQREQNRKDQHAWRQRVKEDSDLIDVTPASDIDQIVAHLGQAVRLAQNLTPADARRARDFMHAAYSMLTATTYLPGQDQARFEHALREDVARMR